MSSTLAETFLRLAFFVSSIVSGTDPVVLEGVCRYESDSGRILTHHNRNGSFDVGFCQNHRKKSHKQPPIPSHWDSIMEAGQELAYWKKQHNRFCVKMLQNEGTCGKVIHGKWRGVKNCRRPHPWFSHYNHGFRTLKNRYPRGVACFIRKGFQKCAPDVWKKITFPSVENPHVVNQDKKDCDDKTSAHCA